MCALMGKNVPALWLDEPDLYPGVLESFRALKTGIMSSSEEGGREVFLITGSDTGVGTSTVAANLALAFGIDMEDKSTLLVDVNSLAPSLHQAFGVSESPGLIELLQGRGSLGEIVKSTPVGNVHLLPLGQNASRSKSPFGSEDFSKLLAKVKSEFDFMIIDAPPALHSSLTQMLAARVDGVVLVVEGNRTRSEVVGAIQRKLAGSGGKLLGSFLNRRRYVIPKWLYRFI